MSWALTTVCTDIQGAVGLAQIEKFDYILEKRREKAARYDEMLSRRCPFLKTPHVRPDIITHISRM